MTQQNANPSVNPADLDSLTGTFRTVFTKMMQSINGVLPAQVIAFDRTKAVVQVQPLIQLIDTNNNAINRGQIASIPVWQLGGGGFLISFNLNPGDMGLIVACDRDISLFLQSGNIAPPNTFRIKDFADSFFLPMVINNFTINGEDMENFVLQSLDNSTRLSFSPTRIKCVTPLFAVDGNITASGTITPNIPAPP